MILIISHKEDFTCDFLIDKLNQRKIPYKRFNCEDIIENQYLVTEVLNFSFEQCNYFSSVWFRRTKLPLIQNVSNEEKAYLLNEYESLLKNLFSIIDSKWLSNPFDVYRAENKLLQLKLAKKIGFVVPQTLVTNSRDKLKKFYFDNNQDLIIKPLSQSRLYDGKTTSFLFTNRLKKEHIENIDEYDLTPCIYQNRVEKDIELRITVVGDDIFVAGVNSQILEETKTDWRKSKLTFFKSEIPNDIADKCLSIVKNLNLRFGAIDMIKDLHGNYIFLEINPNGQWAWIESETGLKISDSIIKELL